MTPQDTSVNRQYDDEISLVDLATILVKRWKAMVAIFTVVVLAALAYALLMPRTYSYSSIYNVAEEGPGNALESPESLVAKARNLYVGPVTRELLVETGLQSLPFELEIVNPGETLLVTLTSEANEAEQKLVAQLHKEVLMRLQQGQQVIVERRTDALERQLQSARASLDAAEQSDSLGAAEVVASIMSRIAGLEANLEELRKGEVNQTAVQSLEPTGTSRTVIILLAIVAGAMFAVLGAFLTEFINAVKQKMKI